MSFTLIPAIDLRAAAACGCSRAPCEDETVFSEDPVATARGWQAQGARGCTWWISTAPSRPPRADRHHPRRHRRARASRCRWAGASETPPRCRACWTRAPAWAWWARAPRSTRFLGESATPSPAGSSCRWTPPTARWRWTAGSACSSSRPPTSPVMPPPPAPPPCSIPTSPATGPARARISGARRRWRARPAFRCSPRVGSARSTTSAAGDHSRRGGGHRGPRRSTAARWISGRALAEVR
jgi:hypothetical protein